MYKNTLNITASSFLPFIRYFFFALYIFKLAEKEKKIGIVFRSLFSYVDFVKNTIMINLIQFIVYSVCYFKETSQPMHWF